MLIVRHLVTPMASQDATGCVIQCYTDQWFELRLNPKSTCTALYT